MKIVSWNMNKRKEGSWSYLIEKIDPDFALLQESSPILSDDLRMNSGVGTMSRQFVLGTMKEFDWVQMGAAIKHPENGKELI